MSFEKWGLLYQCEPPQEISCHFLHFRRLQYDASLNKLFQMTASSKVTNSFIKASFLNRTPLLLLCQVQVKMGGGVTDRGLKCRGNRAKELKRYFEKVGTKRERFSLCFWRTEEELPTLHFQSDRKRPSHQGLDSMYVCVCVCACVCVRAHLQGGKSGCYWVCEYKSTICASFYRPYGWLSVCVWPVCLRWKLSNLCWHTASVL